MLFCVWNGIKAAGQFIAENLLVPLLDSAISLIADILSVWLKIAFEKGYLNYFEEGIGKYQILNPVDFLFEIRRNQLIIEILVDGKILYSLEPFGSGQFETLGLSEAEKEANMIAETYLGSYLTLFTAAAVMTKAGSLLAYLISGIFAGIMVPLIFLRLVEDLNYLVVQPLDWSGDKYLEFLDIMAAFHLNMASGLFEMAASSAGGDIITKGSMVVELFQLVVSNWVDFKQGRTYAWSPNIIAFAGLLLVQLARNRFDASSALFILSVVGGIIHLIVGFAFGGKF
ncbi:MAG: hypothetical protein D6732_21315 [Methanobacteriota archaeon]|nr:MAG: hypothetical protein D6732_21315 [Euryarchaeota archaeon]